LSIFAKQETLLHFKPSEVSFEGILYFLRIFVFRQCCYFLDTYYIFQNHIFDSYFSVSMDS